jgi:hypothetical protein
VRQVLHGGLQRDHGIAQVRTQADPGNVGASLTRRRA